MTKIVCVFFLALSFLPHIKAQKYITIKGWLEKVNQRIETFLNSTKEYKDRKIAAFDCDGTVF